MTSPRFPSPSPLAANARLELGEPVARHAHVLRLSPGDAITVFDTEGRQAAATIVSLDASSIVVALSAIDERAPELHAPVLIQCVPKGSKLDDIVRAATEAGASEIHLALASRSIARAEARLDRLNRIALEAARQSEAPRVPRIVAPAPLHEVAARAPSTSPRLVLSPRTEVRMRDVDTSRGAWLVVGPEGGLEDAETGALVAMGYALVRIDTHVLRTEHAGPIAIAIARELAR